MKKLSKRLTLWSLGGRREGLYTKIW